MSGPEGGGAPPPSTESLSSGSSDLSPSVESPLTNTTSPEGAAIETGSGDNAPSSELENVDFDKWEQELADGGDPDKALRDFANDEDNNTDASSNPIDTDQAKRDELMDKTPDELAKLAAEGDQDAADFLKGMNPNQTTEDTSNPYDATAAGMRDRLNAARAQSPEDLQKAAAEGNVLAKQALRDQEKQVSAEAEDFLKQQNQQTQENAVSSQPDSTEPQIEKPTDMTQDTATADQMKNEFVAGAKFHEPTAEERANGQQVTPTSPEQTSPAQTTETTDTANVDTTSEQNQQDNEQSQETNEQQEQNDENTEDAGENKDEEKTPEQEAAELRLGRDKLVQEMLKVNPNLDLSKPEVQNFLDMAGENKDNMNTMTEMTKQFIGPEAMATAEKLGMNPETYAKGSVEGIINNMEQNLKQLKAELAKNPTAALKDQEKKDGWVIKLLKALLELIKTLGVMAKSAFESATGKEKKDEKKKTPPSPIIT